MAMVSSVVLHTNMQFEKVFFPIFLIYCSTQISVFIQINIEQNVTNNTFRIFLILDYDLKELDRNHSVSSERADLKQK